MSHVIAILGLALLCAIWVVVQIVGGRAPRACKGIGNCDPEAPCKRTCPPDPPSPPGTRTRLPTHR